MGKISKCRKGIDRISNLPDSIISHILSFLSTKDAVRTSVLSTQWIHHWTSITHLDFNDGYCPWGIDNSYDATTSQFNFVHFVYRVLLSKVTRLDSFRLRCWRNYGGLIHVHSWLSAALSRNVGEIDLSVPMCVIDLPTPPWSSLKLNFLFSSTTLVVLKLGRGFLLKVPNIISLESLKVLYLYTVAFEDNESLPRLVSSCPCLEELEMNEAFSESMEVNVLNISSQALKRLSLTGMHHPYSYDLVLNTPSLEYLEHIEVQGVPDSYHVEMKTLHCLDEAHLCLPLDSKQYDYYDDKLILAKSMADLAVAISNVRILYLSESAFKALNHEALTNKSLSQMKTTNKD